MPLGTIGEGSLKCGVGGGGRVGRGNVNEMEGDVEREKEKGTREA
jgi:hypothetical protein